MDLHLLIDGRLVCGDLSMPVINPATEEVLARSPRASEAQLSEAVAAANASFPAWAARPLESRKAALLAIADCIDAHAGELARLLTQEQGKPIGDAGREVWVTALVFRTYAAHDLTPEIISDGAAGRVELRREPLGVVAAIVPWNFPLLLMAQKVSPALLAGNTVVVKPAPTTPLTTLKFGELVADLLPAGVLNVVTDANDLGGALSQHPDVRKVSFTGSATTGRKVMASAAATLKRLSLELGGNDAAIVLDDVDPKAAAPKIFGSAFGNNGQFCDALKRLYVHESIYDTMCSELAALADAAIVGDGLDPSTTHGPVQNKMQFDKVLEILAEAREHGTVIAGGTRPDRRGYFLRPTIIRDIAEGTRLVDEEQFGPILPVIRYSDETDALERANHSTYGLGGSIWSSNRSRGYALAERLEAGSVWINQHGAMNVGVPYGGTKQSGFGTALGREGLLEYTHIRVINSAASS
jgi:acyl-CoA reductase-like NAD-dependent aldehyde dehydrogenase